MVHKGSQSDKSVETRPKTGIAIPKLSDLPSHFELASTAKLCYKYERNWLKEAACCVVLTHTYIHNIYKVVNEPQKMFWGSRSVLFFTLLGLGIVVVAAAIANNCLQ